MERQNTYHDIIDSARGQLKVASLRVYIFGFIKLLIVASAVTVCILLWGHTRVLLIALFVLVILFLLLTRIQDRFIHRESYLKKKIEVCTQELAALEGDLSAFDDGKEYTNENHYYTYDIDIFGPGSLFQAICRTGTSLGKSRLADALNRHLTDIDAIRQRQDAVRELSEDLDFRLDFRITGLLANTRQADEEEILQWAKAKSAFCHNKIYCLLPTLFLVTNIVLFGCAFLGLVSWLVPVNVWVLLAMGSFTFSQRITHLQVSYDKELGILSTYTELLRKIEQTPRNSALLQALKQYKVRTQVNDASTTGTPHHDASEAIGRLGKLMNALDNRGNLLMLFVRNGLYCWELRQVIAIERWRERHAVYLPAWLDCIGQTDALCSFATFAYNHPAYIYPVPVAAPFRLEGEGLGHPLMAPQKCVTNPVHLNGEPSFLTITGANMAGKSTYLRTVAINYLLACVGAPVMAEHFTFTPAQLLTSLRTNDSLRAGESYFFAELKRLKLIIDLLNSGEKLFILLDEILRGTNSMDKQKGSYAFIRQLVNLHADGIIATHDLQLATLAERFPDSVRNYRFEADIVDGELHFSYRLKPGVAQNMNACFLMKKMGIDVE
jgi:ABC-type multidrug transport system fused ATPase/permease subunit